MKRLILSLFILSLLFITSCIDEGTGEREEYEKCTAVCASVLEDDFVTLELCREECKKKFLDEKD